MIIIDLLRQALEARASDLHLTVKVPPLIRVDGDLIPMPGRETLETENIKEIVDEMMSAEQKEKFERLGEIDISYSQHGVGRFRVNIYRQRGSIGAAMRVVNSKIPTLEELGLPEVVRDLTQKRRGLILVTGPTGSGKSTTLASMIDIINSERSEHILTLEDPIEYLHKHKSSMVNQREIGADSQSYANALRAALRQDPDVILVGEMRDLETIATAITAAETGHLVLSTLHTLGAGKTIDRIVDVFPPYQQEQIRVQLASVLEGIISQQLIVNSACNGRVGAFEVLTVNSAVRNMIREGKTYQIPSVIQTGAKFGMVSMDKALEHLYKNAEITKEKALFYAFDQDSLKKMLY
ncbi:MAG: type IV pilus twitching motility protein PilT [Clostridiales bacterium]|nr:type IV pilus twitching motility protein PilT [Clostridiales bacterium]